MPTEILGTIAEAAVTFAGFAALAVVIPQLSGRQWEPAMSTGLWLMVTLSFGAFFFSLLPLVLAELGAEDRIATAASSAALATFILLSTGLAARRDRRLVREGFSGPPLAPIASAATVSLAMVLMLSFNAFGVLPGSAGGWYAVGVLSLLLMACVPLGIFLRALGSRQ